MTTGPSSEARVVSISGVGARPGSASRMSSGRWGGSLLTAAAQQLPGDPLDLAGGQ